MKRAETRVSDLPPFALLQDDVNGVRRTFSEPDKILVAHNGAELEQAFAEAEQARRDGKWLAGYVSYETGYLLEEKLVGRLPENRTMPLLLLGIFDNPDIASFRPRERQNPLPAAPFSEAKATWTRSEYAERFHKVRRHLALGDIYQANLTFPLQATWQGDPVSMFATLIERQPVRHGGIINLGGPMVLSRSPEMFFEVDADGWIETRPMKGTAKRGKTANEDETARTFLANDPKNQSENRMIVDLLRNDISRITEVGSLHVPELFKVETYPSLHQMISRIRARLLPGLSLRDMFAALFPCGSITGAPKISAMQIIHDLEARARDVYCGSIGWVAPDGRMSFNVAIRTVVLHEGGKAVFNVGSGVVFDSDADAEYDECLLKARFAAAKISTSD